MIFQIFRHFSGPRLRNSSDASGPRFENRLARIERDEPQVAFSGQKNATVPFGYAFGRKAGDPQLLHLRTGTIQNSTKR